MVAREAGGDTEKGSGKGGWSEINGDKDKLLGSHSHLLRLGCLGLCVPPAPMSSLTFQAPSV